MNKLNPFSTRFIQPGALEYLEDVISVEELARRLIHDRRTFQIVGPHGAGKTSLTIAIAKQLRPHSYLGRWLTLQKASTFASPTAKHESYIPQEHVSESAREILFVDGVENLGAIQRTLTLRSLRTAKTQLVVTAHRKLLGYPVLAEVEPNSETFRNLALQLYPTTDPEWLAKIDKAFETACGDYREAFFLLYDECR